MEKQTFMKIYNEMKASDEPFAIFLDNDKVMYENHSPSMKLIVDEANSLIYCFRLSNSTQNTRYNFVAETVHFETVQLMQKTFWDLEGMTKYIESIPVLNAKKDEIIKLDNLLKV